MSGDQVDNFAEGHGIGQASPLPQLSEIQRELHAWLNKEAPALADPYLAAIRLIGDPGFPARTHLVSHVVRDIISILPEILDGQYRRKMSGGVFRNRAEKIKEEWKVVTPYQQSVDSDLQRLPATVEVRTSGADQVAELLRELEEILKQPKSGEALFYALLEKSPIKGRAISRKLAILLEAERSWFVKRAHLSHKVKEYSSKDLEIHFDQAERAIHVIIGGFYAGKEELDGILDAANR